MIIYLGEGAQQPIARVILAASLVLYVVAYSSWKNKKVAMEGLEPSILAL